MRLPWTTRLYHLLKGPNPLHPRIWHGRLSPLTFRRFSPEDTPACLELYSLTEPGRFPADGRADYEAFLNTQKSYVLVGERDGRLVTSGGLNYFFRKDIAVLCYGLVHPETQGTGIGTALVLARLALLDPKEPTTHVFVFAVEKSIGFYRRFGFQPSVRWKDKHGKMQPSGRLRLASAEILKCRKLLEQNGITFPRDEPKVPLREVSEKEMWKEVKLCVSCGTGIPRQERLCPKCGWTQPDAT